MDQLTETLTKFALSVKFEDLDAAVVTRAKQLITDSIGCGLGGSQSPTALIARDQAAQVSHITPATVMVSGSQTSPDLATFANGVMIRYLDFNDTFIGAGGGAHPSDLLAPALAVAEHAGRNGRDLITALIVGYEIYCALGDTSAQPEAWDQATYAVIAASVLASKLFDLSQLKMEHALSMSLASHMAIGQIRVGQISHWKGCAVPNAARNAVFCSMLASQGMTGPNDVFEGSRGFRKATGWSFDLPPLGGQDRAFRIMRTNMKAYPAGYFSQSAIEAALAARDELPDVAQIVAIHLETFPYGHRAMAGDESRWCPQTRETADHSLPFVVAIALMDGTVDLHHFEDEYYKRPEVRVLMDKIVVAVGEESTKAWPDEPLSVLNVELDTGHVITRRCGSHVGHFSNPMSYEDQDSKLRPLAQTYAGLAPSQVDELMETLQDLERVESIRDLVALTVPRS